MPSNPLPPQSSRNSFGARDAAFSASGKNRRGRRNRFATQASRDSEPERIVALMTLGMKGPAIAEAMKMSVATAYRRIAAIRLPPEGVATKASVERREKLAAALLALLQANTARAHSLVAERMEKRSKAACCPECRRTALTIESIRLDSEVQKVELAYLRQIGVFDIIRSSGRAAEIIRAARTIEEPEKVLRVAADITGTKAGVDKYDVRRWSMANLSRKHEKK